MNNYFPGMPDEEFIRGEIPMTKQEIRIVALAKARISPGDIIIDIGAGTGSLSIEAACQAPEGRVTAIERELEGIELIQRNAERFKIDNIQIIHGCAPEALAGLPSANVVFVGGSGGHLAAILDKADELLLAGGRLIIMSVTVETLYAALQWGREKRGYTVNASGLQVNRLRQAGSVHMFQALNQVYIITCHKEDNQ